MIKIRRKQVLLLWGKIKVYLKPFFWFHLYQGSQAGKPFPLEGVVP